MHATLVSLPPQVLLQPEDEFLVIASDGLWESVPVLDAIRWARKEFQAGKKPNEVRRRYQRRGEQCSGAFPPICC